MHPVGATTSVRHSIINELKRLIAFHCDSLLLMRAWFVLPMCCIACAAFMRIVMAGQYLVGIGEIIQTPSAFCRCRASMSPNLGCMKFFAGQSDVTGPVADVNLMVGIRKLAMITLPHRPAACQASHVTSLFWP